MVGTSIHDLSHTPMIRLSSNEDIVEVQIYISVG